MEPPSFRRALHEPCSLESFELAAHGLVARSTERSEIALLNAGGNGGHAVAIREDLREPAQRPQDALGRSTRAAKRGETFGTNRGSVEQVNELHGIAASALENSIGDLGRHDAQQHVTDGVPARGKLAIMASAQPEARAGSRYIDGLRLPLRVDSFADEHASPNEREEPFTLPADRHGSAIRDGHGVEMTVAAPATDEPGHLMDASRGTVEARSFEVLALRDGESTADHGSLIARAPTRRAAPEGSRASSTAGAGTRGPRGASSPCAPRGA